MKKIEFYFDFLSPYSYLAWTWVRSQPYEFEYYPVSMATIIASYDTKGPAQIEPKRNYLFKDLLRATKMNNIPFTTPKNLPFNSLYALRLALIGTAGDKQKEIIDVIYRAGWEHGLDIGSDDVLKEILKEKNLYSDELIEKMESKNARIELKSNVERALQRELFGVPSFVVDGEMFWGYDSTKYLEMYLNGMDPLDREMYQQFIAKFTPR
ncbi:2-hydroxychromene-2-carboxylate isomerase [Bacteriovorax sp. PP10]|uniref:2-hydroxychromene-2-carboxylate isomerase n=1 Tax=Bacteriovorax antarcticus TaxID=3088717 RepID=A0ABU5VU11_9BACT|nr:2-hydroxychromene-2-carboxylate isomerase [Bacteriovorax sp. PP10]MEA9355868.1 2-hydroxychromene-2-carboxylate isomerase [Bacteriovorax sp. PP10]